MKGIRIKLTKKQLETLQSLRNGQEGQFWVLGQAWIDLNNWSVPIGTTEFHVLDMEQGLIINRAIKRAKKLGKKSGSTPKRRR